MLTFPIGFMNQSSQSQIDPYLANVVLHLKGDGANNSTTIVDSSPTPKTITVVGNTKISTAQSKYGGSSIYFDGAEDYVQLPNSSDFAFGTNNFCIETWVQPSGRSRLYPRIINFSNTWGTNDSWSIMDRHNNNPNNFNVAIFKLAGNSNILNSTTTVINNTWYHLAITRKESTFRLFVNGILEASYINSGAVDQSSTNTARIGSLVFTDNQDSFFGYIDSFRITKGEARYTTNFNPETDTYLAY